MKLWLFIVAFILFLPGCEGAGTLAILDQVRETGQMVEDKALDAAAKTVDAYGDRTPEDLRVRLRDGINSRTERWDIMVVPK